MTDKANWDLVSFVMASEIRFRIMVSLNERVQTPTELMKKFVVPISRISAVLKELNEKKLIENLTPERRKVKMYSLTNLGKNVLQEIHKLTEVGGGKVGK